MLAGISKETIILKKTNGEKIEIAALVQPDLIFVEDETANIEEDDVFVRTLPNGNREYYQVIDRGYYDRMGGMKAHYQVKVRKIKNLPDHVGIEKQRLVFISHSTADKAFTKAFVDMLDGIGLDDEQIVCSSYPGLGIPLDENIYDWLVGRFQKYDLHVFFFLSHNYYRSAASLNEMGAAWAMKQKWTGILLPEFGFDEIEGCIDPRQISIKLDGEKEELKHRLGELKDALIKEFDLKPISGTKWERVRDQFLNSVDNIEVVEEEAEQYVPTPIINSDRSSISVHACIMLMYAAVDDGHIMVIPSMASTDYIAGKVTLQRNQTGRELAVWDDAVSQLYGKGYIKLVGRKDKIYQVTKDGYDLSDAFIKDNQLDPRKTPNEILAEFGEPQE